MAILVIAEHDGKQLKPGTANTITAATKLGGDVTVLIAGHKCADAGATVAKVQGVTKVLVADSAEYAHALPARRRGLRLREVRPADVVGETGVPRVRGEGRGDREAAGSPGADRWTARLRVLAEMPL